MNLESDVADAPSPISKDRKDILEEVEELVSHQEKIDRLYHFIKHGDHDTREHAWDILEELYAQNKVVDTSVENSRIIATKKSSKEN